MSKKITKEEIQKLITIFKKMHFDNSVRLFRSRRKFLAPDSVKYDDGYNVSFTELRDIINNLLMQCDEKGLSEKSFITYQEKSITTNPTELSLSLKDYLDLIKRSRNYFEYFSKLRDRKPYYHALYMPDELNDFCFKHIFSLFISVNLYFDHTMDIKRIEYKNSYLYAREPLEFEKLELLWKGGQYSQLIQECRNILTHVVGNYQRKLFGKKEQEIKKYLEEITLHYKIENLNGVLGEIFEQFRVMRNKLGKGELGFESDRDWIESFKNSPEINKKLYTRIIVDELKVLHNILAILETEKDK